MTNELKLFLGRRGKVFSITDQHFLENSDRGEGDATA